MADNSVPNLKKNLDSTSFYFTGQSDFRMTLKSGFGTVRYFFYQPVDENIKTWTLCFPNKENALFDWPIVLQYDVKAKYRLIFFLFHPRVRLINQKPSAFVTVR